MTTPSNQKSDEIQRSKRAKRGINEVLSTKKKTWQQMCTQGLSNPLEKCLRDGIEKKGKRKKFPWFHLKPSRGSISVTFDHHRWLISPNKNVTEGVARMNEAAVDPGQMNLKDLRRSCELSTDERTKRHKEFSTTFWPMLWNISKIAIAKKVLLRVSNVYLVFFRMRKMVASNNSTRRSKLSLPECCKKDPWMKDQQRSNCLKHCVAGWNIMERVKDFTNDYSTQRADKSNSR